MSDRISSPTNEETVSLRMAVESPENVRLTYELAGPAARCLAYGLDTIVRALVLVFGLIVAMLTSRVLPGVTWGAVLVLLFLLEWGYFIFSEGLFRGKTLGKEALGLRVVQLEGYPITLWSAMQRNLMRVVDGIPLFAFLALAQPATRAVSVVPSLDNLWTAALMMPVYGPALCSMILTRRFQRLGDLVAGTVVISERRSRLRREAVIISKIEPLSREEIGRQVPEEETLALIDEFLSRRIVLTHDRGHELCADFAVALAQETGVPRRPLPASRLSHVVSGPRVCDIRPQRRTRRPDRPGQSRRRARGHGRGGLLAMNKRDFVEHRRPAWSRFQQMLDGLECRSFRKMSGAHLREFSRFFRELAHDLALVRSRGWGEGLETYLNDLAARGNNVFYQAPPGRMSRFLDFLAGGYPRVFRKNAAYFWSAALCFFLPMLIAWAVVQNSPGLAHRVMEPAQLQRMEDMYGSDNEAEPGELIFAEERATMGGFYVYNNVGIALCAFAAGLLFGTITVYVLVSNGIIIGTIAGYLISQNHGNAFLSFVISHGAFELTAIAVAGGAGFMLGGALLHPGRRTRLENLQVRGREAVQIAGGAVVMLLIAALLEAFWSPTAIPPIIKYTVGTILWALVALYLLLVGRDAPE